MPRALKDSGIIFCFKDWVIKIPGWSGANCAVENELELMVILSISQIIGLQACSTQFSLCSIEGLIPS